MPIESPNFVQDVKVKHADCALLAVFHEVVSVVPINLPKTKIAPHLTLLAFHLSSLKGHLGSSTLEVQTHGPTRSYSSKLCNIFLVNFHKSTVQMQLILAHAVEAPPLVGSEYIALLISELVDRQPGAMPAAATAAPDSRITMAAMKGFPWLCVCVYIYISWYNMTVCSPTKTSNT